MYKHSVIGSLLLILLGFETVCAQSVAFDAMHPTDGAIYLKTVAGNKIPHNTQGDAINISPLFKKDISDRVAQGVTKSIIENGTSSVADGAAASPTFHLTYLDVANNTNAGFDHPTLGQQRRNALEAAFAYYSSVIEEEGEADIEIRESFSANPNSNPFAFSAAYYFGSKGFNSPFTKSHIVSGSDPYGGFPDGYIQFNFHNGLPYNYSTTSSPSSQQFDFYTIALHEIMHLLGFTSYSTANGQSAASPDVFTSFDAFLFDNDNKQLFAVTGSGSSAYVAPPQDGSLTSNQVWFELYTGEHAPVFSPSSFNGSSLDHFDNERSNHEEYLMHPSLSTGDAFKILHEDEVRVLERLGYQVNYNMATSIEEVVSGSTASGLYPNPAHTADRVQIDLESVEDKEILVIVYDMMGRQSYSKVILNAGAGPITAIDPHNNLPPGMYIVVGSSKKGLFNEKLVIK